ncbi:ABC transporter permease [Lysinibacillus fusiformis]|uniref:ABC transporter permease n=1 Tax=Lysinibacillus fusiformis TaxID=28031 RepID=UPI001EF5002B|nr:ABC transporter permease [Lysinibacillus fusiformis]MCG7437666.1 ABC transporter permease [Lysinibacillus fusiformis]
MVKLILIEYRKNFLKSSIMGIILLFSILNIIKIYSVYNNNSLLSQNIDPKWNGLYWEMYEDFGGEITLEKSEKLMSIYRPLEKKTADRTASRTMDNPNTYTGNVYNDHYFFLWNYVKPMEYAYMYKSNSNDIVNDAKENMLFYESIGNPYEYRKNVIIAEVFKERIIPEFSYNEMYQYYTHYDFSAFLVILICLYCLIRVFVSEKETEMDILLLTTIAGGTKTVIAKIIASAIFIFIICWWYWLIDFISFSLIFDSFEAAFTPVFSIENFSYSSIRLSLGEYAILSCIVKTLGILVLGMMYLLISSLFKNALLPFIINMSITLGLFYIQGIYMGSGHILMKILNPLVLVINREVFRKTEFVNLFGYPLLSYIPAILFAITLGVLCILIIFILIRKNAVYDKEVRERAIVDF